MLLLRILIFISAVLIFQEQYGFEFLLKKGIYVFDITSLLSILVFIVLLIKGEVFLRKNSFVIPSLVFLSSIFISCLFSSDILESFKYFSFLGFYALFGFVVYQVLIDFSHEAIIKSISFIVLIVSLVGFYDVIAVNNNLPYFNRRIEANAMKSGFLFFGIAADFIHIMLCILIPFQLSQKTENRKVFFLNSAAIFLGILFLLGTTRVSVIISFLISLGLLFVFNLKYLKKKTLILYFSGVVFSIIGIIVFIPSLLDRVLYRFKTRIFERKTNTLEADFFPDNIKSAFSMFSENKISGVGYGTSSFNFKGDLFTIHGTFFKLLSETGILGFLGYFCLLVSIVYFIIKHSSKKKESFAYQFIPFLIGLVISSIYNVHFVRIEFWILLAVILIFSKNELKKI